VAKADCAFCAIARDGAAAARVGETDAAVVFLDKSPVFRGHCLIVPRMHVETLSDLPDELVAPMFACAKRVARAAERALGCGGTFVAMNNRVSQSVPHLHVHVVPRTKGDGLRGFFWPRVKYASAEEMEEMRAKIAAAFVAD